jgi:hypothetical protein
LRRIAQLRQRVHREQNLGFDQLLLEIDDDLRQFGAGPPNETYSDVVRHLHGLVDNLRAELKQLNADKDRLQQDYVALEETRRVAIAEADAAKQAARNELLAERAGFLRTMSARDDEISLSLDRANTLAERLEKELREKETVREELLAQINRQRHMLVQARTPHTPDALARQKPDGRIIRSSAATKTAWLNIGSKHGVEPQLTFSVQPTGFTGNPLAKPKAKIEVIKVSGPNLSEARIVESSLMNPVIEGDEIYNPAWDPGKVVHFALAGFLDMDGDGRDDRDKLKGMIIQAGGKIDAEVLPDGSIWGEVTVETNYFVRGQSPDTERLGLLQTRALTSMAQLERTALDYGAVVIDLSKFLDLMGYKPFNPLR